MHPLGLSSVFVLLQVLWKLGPATGITTNITANIPSSPPSNSETLVPTLLSFSIEQDRWPDWTGRDSRNIYTFNALTNYAELTGQPPKIRVGANSADGTRWDPNVNVIIATFPSSNKIIPYPEATSLDVSNGYYELAKFMPGGTRMTWGLNLRLDNVTNAVNMAQSIFRAFSTSSEATKNGVILDMLELGNEPDLYRGKARPADWKVSQYVQDWIDHMTSIVAAVKLTVGGSIGVVACSFSSQVFTAAGTFDAGLLESEPGKHITRVSQHRYSGVFCHGGSVELRSFMSKSAVRGNLTIFTSDIAATRSRGLIYVLGETNSIACHGAPGLSNTAGAALWTIDYTLQAATLGIQELYFHQGIGFKYNFFQPVTLNRSPIDNSPLSPPSQPYIQPSYYAGLVINTAVGNRTASGTTKIVELKLSAPNLSGYAVYEAGKPVRAVFVNLDAWVKSDEGIRQRNVYHISLAFASAKGIKIKRLAIEYADDISDLTWGGQSWETPDFLVSGNETFETQPVDEGVSLGETEAVLARFE